MSVLVTGGTGFIGSHTSVELLNAGYDVIIVDNLCNSSQDIIERIFEITGKKPIFYKADVRDRVALEKIFEENDIDVVIHFAALKAVGESVVKPLEYYENNIVGTLSLCDAMRRHGCRKIIFSSSATVYGSPKTVPIKEDFPLSTTNPYGSTKLMMEMILKDIYVSDPSWSVVLLRYFNPVGAHESGLIGEFPKGVPNNLMPYITQVGIGKLEYLSVFGNDYPTRDGTGVRDYVHVVDLAEGHIKAMDKALNETGIYIYNLGTGTDYSVLEMVHAFEEVNHVKIPYVIKPRRPGDIAECYADPSKAFSELGWKAKHSLKDMCSSVWSFAKKNLL